MPTKKELQTGYTRQVTAGRATPQGILLRTYFGRLRTVQKDI